MGEFRTVVQIRALPDLRPQEEKLLEKAEAGEELILGDGELPNAGDESRIIRAGIIRYLLLGGCEELRCHERGVQIVGALVPSHLHMGGCDAPGSLSLKKCRFEEPLILESASFRNVHLDGSHCPGIEADRLRVRGSLHLRNEFCATGVVRLAGAEIAGSLSCVAGTMKGTDGEALVADRLKVGGAVFLRSRFCAGGVVRLVGAEIGGSLSCSEGQFNYDKGIAFDASNARIDGTFFWRSVVALGPIELSGGSCLDLNDNWQAWPKSGNSIILNGFTYNTISGDANVDAESRLNWLALNDNKGGFRPQPYQHLAKVLREMGHAEDARKVMVEKERLQRADRLAWLKERLASLQPTTPAPEDQQAAQRTRVDRHQLKLDLWWSPKWNFLFRRLVGYGYYPFNSFWAGLALFLLAAALFSATWHSGAFAPNSPVVLISEEWEAVATLSNPAVEWEAGPGRDYETYNSLAYAFDTVIPLIDLGQESAWSPSTSRGPIGWIAWWAKWIFKVAGWIITALGAAALTGIIRRD